MDSPDSPPTSWHQLLAPAAIPSPDGNINFGERPEDCAILADSGSKPLLAPLPSRGGLLLEGPDASRFLQGQFSCDVLKLAVGDCRPSACCSPKGRVVANPLLWRIGEQSWLLVAPRSVITALRKFLERYLVFSRAELRDISDEWLSCASFGAVDFAGSAVQADAPDSEWGGTLESGLWRRIAAQWCEMWLPATQAASIWQQLLSHETQPVGEAIWQLRQIRCGYGEVSQQTSGLFLPQMLNLDALGGIDYDKGCYTGQEVVARAHFLGQIKRRLYRVAVSALSSPEPGATLLGANGDSCGTVLCSAPIAASRWELLAVLRCDSADTAQFDGQTLQLLPLPYPLDES